MYAATAGARPLTFQVSGMLWNRSLVMRDLETGTLWSHILGEAMRGELLGEKLAPVPCVISDWGTWKSNHPKTTVLALKRSAQQFRTDFQKKPGAFVLGFVVRGEAMAYPFDVLKARPLINDTFRELPVLVVFDEASTAARIYQRRLGERTFTFHPGEGKNLVDAESKSVWNPATGRCISGPLKGKSLSPLPGIVSFRKAWDAFHPESDFFSK